MVSKQEQSMSDLKFAVMVNLMCQLDWAMGCQDIWLNSNPGVAVRE